VVWFVVIGHVFNGTFIKVFERNVCNMTQFKGPLIEGYILDETFEFVTKHMHISWYDRKVVFNKKNPEVNGLCLTMGFNLIM
jgi:hypothetical protein